MRKHFFLCTALIWSTFSFSQNWTGAVSSDWNNPSNWSAAPSNGDDIVIDPANYSGAMAHPVISVNSSFSPAEMLVQNGAVLTINANLSASDRVEILGAGTIVTINSGTFLLNGGGNNERLIFAEDAHLQMEGGTISTGQRLLFELGGTGEVNGGTITVGETIALVDGSPNGSSTLIQNGGTITTGNEFGFENEAGIFYPAFIQTGGDLTIDGALIWLGAAPGAGRGYFRSSGGNIIVGGSIGNDPASTMGMHLELSGEAFLENNGNLVQLMAGDSIVMKDVSHWQDMNTAVSWLNAGVFDGSGESEFIAGFQTTLNGTGSYQFKHVAIPSTHWLNHISPAIIRIAGIFSSSGSFSHGNNKIILNGNAQQNINAIPWMNLYDLEIANSGAGVELFYDLNIAHNLQLTDGILYTAALSPGSIVRLPDDATMTGGSDSSFVDVKVEKTGNDSITFHIGKAPDRYRPLTISAPASASTVVKAQYVFDAHDPLIPAEAPLQSISALEYWDMSRIGSSDLFTATIGWNDASQSGLTDCNDISLTVWDGAHWAFVPSTATGQCGGANAGTLVSGGDLPAIGPLTIGFTNNVYQNTVEICFGDSVIVDTNTYAVSGVYTDILQDQNGNDSTIITILTVNEPLSVNVSNNIDHLSVIDANADTYQWIDCTTGNAVIAGATSSSFYPAVNGSYAVIVEKNGCADTSTCYVISQLALEEQTTIKVIVYPNPANDNVVVVFDAATADVTITDAHGKTVRMKTIESNASISVKELDNGIYFLTLETESGRTVRRIVKQ